MEKMDTLTREQVNRKIAGFEGYRVVEDCGFHQLYAPNGDPLNNNKSTAEWAWRYAPNYCASLDALRPALERLAESSDGDKEGAELFERALRKIPGKPNGYGMHTLYAYLIAPETIARAVCAVIEEVHNATD
jgi:hypothetical protein